MNTFYLFYKLAREMAGLALVCIETPVYYSLFYFYPQFENAFLVLWVFFATSSQHETGNGSYPV